MPYGTLAVWGGERVEDMGNIGEGMYAFVLDTGISVGLDEYGELNIQRQW